MTAIGTKLPVAGSIGVIRQQALGDPIRSFVKTRNLTAPSLRQTLIHIKLSRQRLSLLFIWVVLLNILVDIIKQIERVVIAIKIDGGCHDFS